MSGDYSLAPQQVSESESSDLLTDVIAGLSSNPRTLPCKYFYDERGAALFQKICELPEYYITRTEIDILDRHRAEIASQVGANIQLIGLGTGAGTKTRILIEAVDNPAAHINRETGANFDLNRWQHRAIYNSEAGRIEMYLISATNQTIRIQDRAVHFHAGERILTEHSYKHTPDGFIALARQAGFDFVTL